MAVHETSGGTAHDSPGNDPSASNLFRFGAHRKGTRGVSETHLPVRSTVKESAYQRARNRCGGSNCNSAGSRHGVMKLSH